MKLFPAYFSLLIFLILGGDMNAQVIVKKDSTYIFEMKDGNTYIGKVIGAEMNEKFEVQTSIGTINLVRKDILNITKFKKSDIKDGEYWPSNPHSSRYFFSPSGYGLRKGEGYYQNAWVLFNQVSYGITDHFSMGAGVMPLFLFGFNEALPFWITPKLNFPYKNGKGAFGAGTFYISAIGENAEGLGILYGSNTFGNRDKQLTIGVGIGYSSEFGLGEYPVFNVGGLIRTSKNWAFISENYILTIDSYGALISGGARYMGKRLAIDFGGFMPVFPGQDQFLIAPWLSISVPFGNRY